MCVKKGSKKRHTPAASHVSDNGKHELFILSHMDYLLKS